MKFHVFTHPDIQYRPTSYTPTCKHKLQHTYVTRIKCFENETMLSSTLTERERF